MDPNGNGMEEIPKGKPRRGEGKSVGWINKVNGLRVSGVGELGMDSGRIGLRGGGRKIWPGFELRVNGGLGGEENMKWIRGGRDLNGK